MRLTLEAPAQIEIFASFGRLSDEHSTSSWVTRIIVALIGAAIL